MDKSSRLNDTMLFLNNKNSFNLKDLMDKYGISKSTALRDIKTLEEIGMPIFSKPGRNGHYGILKNRLLSPIVFNIDEVLALYFSMITLKAYESTPFHLSIERLKYKFENCLSPEKIEMLRKTESVFSLGVIQQKNFCRFLSDILQFTIEETVCEVLYIKDGSQKNYYIQFFDISSAYGQWYATGYNFESNAPQIFRCDKILNVTQNDKYLSKPLSFYAEFADKLFKTDTAINFIAEISLKGVDLFYKEHYPSMQLICENDRYFIHGFYNAGEENFIASYLICYGKNLLSISPASLKELLQRKAQEIIVHFDDLPVI